MIERVPIARRGSTKLIPHVSKRRMRPILDLDPAIGLAAAAVDAVAKFSRDRLSAMELLEGRLQPEVNAGFEPGPRRRERSVRAATKLTQDDRDRSWRALSGSTKLIPHEGKRRMLAVLHLDPATGAAAW
jgi:hypothetical protein